ncbi:Dual 3',5'-cyclic-AMP and -GMP phosphodiesterase 11, partial [Gryllus bimaculatus]
GEKDVKITIDQGIAGQVVISGQVMNVHDTYKDPAFYRRLDEDSGFKTRNMLCVPILSQGEVIAVAQLCNKIDFPHFTKFDEEIAGPFASYCGICIQHTMLYEKMVIAKARQKLTNELMMFHMKQK